MKWFWPFSHMLRLSLNWHHVCRWLSLTIHDQKGSLPCRKFKGQCKIKRELFLGGAFLYFQIPFSDHHGWNLLNAICGRHIFTAISFCPSWYILPINQKNQNITQLETSSHSLKSRSAQAEGPTTTYYSWWTSYLSSEKAGQDKC